MSDKISLYRKYRPQNFKNLVGQDHVRDTLLNALMEGLAAHAYLLCGPRGTGKTSTARLLAKSLNCTDLKDGEPCDKCEMCEIVNDGTLIDLVEIDAASNRGIEEMRSLKEKINFAPTRSLNKIYIIDEVHMLTKEAFNALLKTLEEPPADVYFILATTESHKVPETIISRCQRFDFKRITRKTIETRLMYIAQLEKFEVEEVAIQAIANTANGGLRDAIGLLEQLTINSKLTFDNVKEVLGISGVDAHKKLYHYLKASDSKSALSEIKTIYSQGTDLIYFTKEFLQYLRELLLDAVSSENYTEVNSLLQMIEHIQEAYMSLKGSVIPQLPLEIAIIKTAQDLHRDHQPIKKAEVKEEIVEKKPADDIVLSTDGVMPKMTKASNLDKKKAPKKSEPTAETPQATEVKEEVPAGEKLPLTISHIKENWPRVLELIKTPFVRLSLKEGTPKSVENNEVLIEFTSNFHKEKIEPSEKIMEIESAINEVFEGPSKVKYSVRKVELQTDIAEEEEVEPVERAAAGIKEEPKEDANLADQALEIFGGEFVEEER